MSKRPIFQHHFSEEFASVLGERLPHVEFVDVRNATPTKAATGLLTTGRPRDDLAGAIEKTTDWVHLLSTGIEHFPLDLVPDDIVVTCSRGAGSVPISEWALAMMLAFEKRIPDMWIDDQPDEWYNDPQLGGLAGKTVAILGYGAIGRRVGRLAAAFDMEVVATRRTVPTNAEIAADVATFAPDATAAVESADHIVIGAPLTPATEHMVDEALFAAMKPGVHIVNIARGRLIDQQALRTALDTLVVARASLDTVDPEPLPSGHWLYEHPKVRLSRHISWSGNVGWKTHIDLIAANIEAVLDNRQPTGIVDRIAGY